MYLVLRVHASPMYVEHGLVLHFSLLWLKLVLQQEPKISLKNFFFFHLPLRASVGTP